ncbi:MAG TPA: cellulose synthase operon protein YhjQ/BcsQ, partial [Acetobacteraceae bacterium]
MLNTAPAGRPDRPGLIAFLADGQNDAALRDGLAEAVSEPCEVRRGGIAAAITAMQRSATPRVLIVDLSGEEQPLTALGNLAEVTEPDVVVLAVGELAELDFYRAVTRGLGVREYLPMPLTSDKVALHFAPIVSGQERAASGVLGGHMITVTGARGGGGASTIAVNLAWHLGVMARRHTVLLDPDLHMGLAAFMLDLQPGPGLRLALEAPERIDALLAERLALPAGERLHVLAAHEKITAETIAAPGAAGALTEGLRRRYSFIVADVPFRPLPLNRDLLDLANQRVLVMEPTLACVR